MMQIPMLILAMMAAVAIGNPAPTGCPRTQCHSMMNECSMSYGGYVNFLLKAETFNAMYGVKG